MKNEYTKERTSAIHKSLRLAQILQTKQPEIEGMYKQGMTQPQIADELGISSEYSVSSTIAKNAVGFAIRGYSGNEIYDNFNGLIPTSELEIISKEHIKNNGQLSQTDKKGLFSLSDKERTEISRYGGKIAHEKGLGIHGLSSEEKVKISQKGVESRGDVCWIDGFDKDGKHYPGEIEYALELAKQPEYQHLRGKPNWKVITEEVNIKYHEGKKVRTIQAVKRKAKNARKQDN